MHHLLALSGGRVLTPDGVLTQATLLIEGERISGLVPAADGLPARTKNIDVSGCVVAPGFIDAHVHGGLGHNFMEGTRGAISAISRHLTRGGTTACLATTTSAPPEDLLHALAYASEASRCPLPGQVEIVGIHLEGPFIDPRWAGSHATQHIRQASAKELVAIWEAAGEALRVVTLAPEIPGGADAISFLTQRGVQVSLGHSGATYEQARWSLEYGVQRGTHLYNALPPIHHRAPGPVVALLEDGRAFLELTVDGLHVHPAVVAMTYQLAGPTRLLLITDGADIAGQGDGAYRRWEGTPVIVRAGKSTTPSGSLAGSVLRMDEAVRNAVSLAGVPLDKALRMASETPARALGLSTKGRLAPGTDADVVVLNGDLTAVLTIVRGRIAYDGRCAVAE